MNEIILVVLVVVLLFLPNLLISKLTSKKKFIVQTCSAIVLMVLVWILGPNEEKNSIFIPLLLTIPIVSSWLRELVKYNKYKKTEITTANK